MIRLSQVENLHDLIFKETGKDLSIGEGTGLSIDDPVMMLANRNFCQTQADIICFYLRNYETVAWDVTKQESVVISDKHIDCIELSVSENPDDLKDAWTEKYYFDITDCLEIKEL